MSVSSLRLKERLGLSGPVRGEAERSEVEQVLGRRRFSAAYTDILWFYHTDGCVTEIVADLIEIGVDILNPVQPEVMDPAALKKQYGDRLAFNGTISIQQTLPSGTVQDVRREVKERIETVGVGGGLILAPSHLVQPEVPLENLLALAQAVREFGTY